MSDVNVDDDFYIPFDCHPIVRHSAQAPARGDAEGGEGGDKIAQRGTVRRPSQMIQFNDDEDKEDAKKDGNSDAINERSNSNKFIPTAAAVVVSLMRLKERAALLGWGCCCPEENLAAAATNEDEDVRIGGSGRRAGKKSKGSSSQQQQQRHEREQFEAQSFQRMRALFNAADKQYRLNTYSRMRGNSRDDALLTAAEGSEGRGLLSSSSSSFASSPSASLYVEAMLIHLCPQCKAVRERAHITEETSLYGDKASADDDKKKKKRSKAKTRKRGEKSARSSSSDSDTSSSSSSSSTSSSSSGDDDANGDKEEELSSLSLSENEKKQKKNHRRPRNDEGKSEGQGGATGVPPATVQQLPSIAMLRRMNRGRCSLHQRPIPPPPAALTTTTPTTSSATAMDCRPEAQRQQQKKTTAAAREGASSSSPLSPISPLSTTMYGRRRAAAAAAKNEHAVGKASSPFDDDDDANSSSTSSSATSGSTDTSDTDSAVDSITSGSNPIITTRHSRRQVKKLLNKPIPLPPFNGLTFQKGLATRDSLLSTPPIASSSPLSISIASLHYLSNPLVFEVKAVRSAMHEHLGHQLLPLLLLAPTPLNVTASGSGSPWKEVEENEKCGKRGVNAPLPSRRDVGDEDDNDNANTQNNTNNSSSGSSRRYGSLFDKVSDAFGDKEGLAHSLVEGLLRRRGACEGGGIGAAAVGMIHVSASPTSTAFFHELIANQLDLASRRYNQRYHHHHADRLPFFASPPPPSSWNHHHIIRRHSPQQVEVVAFPMLERTLRQLCDHTSMLRKLVVPAENKKTRQGGKQHVGGIGKNTAASRSSSQKEVDDVDCAALPLYHGSSLVAFLAREFMDAFYHEKHADTASSSSPASVLRLARFLFDHAAQQGADDSFNSTSSFSSPSPLLEDAKQLATAIRRRCTQAGGIGHGDHVDGTTLSLLTPSIEASLIDLFLSLAFDFCAFVHHRLVVIVAAEGKWDTFVRSKNKNTNDTAAASTADANQQKPNGDDGGHDDDNGNGDKTLLAYAQSLWRAAKAVFDQLPLITALPMLLEAVLVRGWDVRRGQSTQLVAPHCHRFEEESGLLSELFAVIATTCPSSSASPIDDAIALIDKALAAVAPSCLAASLMTFWAPPSPPPSSANLSSSAVVVGRGLMSSPNVAATRRRQRKNGDVLALLEEMQSSEDNLYSTLLPRFFSALDDVDYNDKGSGADTVTTRDNVATVGSGEGGEGGAGGETRYPPLTSSAVSSTSSSSSMKTTCARIRKNIKATCFFASRLLTESTQRSLVVGNRDVASGEVKRSSKFAALLQSHGKEEHSLFYQQQQPASLGKREDDSLWQLYAHALGSGGHLPPPLFLEASLSLNPIARTPFDCVAAAKKVFDANTLVGEKREEVTGLRVEIESQMASLGALLQRFAEATAEAQRAEQSVVEAVGEAAAMAVIGEECWHRVKALSDIVSHAPTAPPPPPAPPQPLSKSKASQRPSASSLPAAAASPLPPPFDEDGEVPHVSKAKNVPRRRVGSGGAAELPPSRGQQKAAAERKPNTSVPLPPRPTLLLSEDKMNDDSV